MSGLGLADPLVWWVWVCALPLAVEAEVGSPEFLSWNPSACISVSEGFLRIRIYIRADNELRKLWQVPRKRAERNFADDSPSID